MKLRILILAILICVLFVPALAQNDNKETPPQDVVVTDTPLPYPTFAPSPSELPESPVDAANQSDSIFGSISSKKETGNHKIQRGDDKFPKIIRNSKQLALAFNPNIAVKVTDPDDLNRVYTAIQNGDTLIFPQVSFEGVSPINLRIDQGTTTYIIRRK